MGTNSPTFIDPETLVKGLNHGKEIEIPSELNEVGKEIETTTPLLPIDGMPEFVQNFIKEMEGIYRTPRDYWAGAAIMATALAIGDKMELSTKYKNNPVFWGAFIGNVSNGKTEPLSTCLRYFKRKDAESIEESILKEKEFERLSRMGKNERIEQGEEEYIQKPERAFQYLLSDSTPEGMAETHRINKRGILIYRDELKGWIDDFGRYAKSGEQSNMLSMWSQQPVSYTRKNAPTLNIEKPVVNVTGGIHCELLHTLAADNRAENGFLARIVSFFPDNTEKQLYNNKIPDQAWLDSWDEYIMELTRIYEPRTLILPDTASKLYEAYYNDNVRRGNDKNTSPYMRGVYGKLDIIALRVAIVLRGMNYQLEGISTPGILPREMDAAIQITEYFRATALKVYRQIFGETKFGNYDKKEIAVWLAKHTKLSKSQIADAVLNSSRSQLDRLIKSK
jgi:hypothetical protein